MQISKQGDYAIRTMLALAKAYPNSLAVKEIAEAQDIPKPFLNKIIQTLAKGRLVKTTRGAQGGVKLLASTTEVTLRDIIEVIEGPIAINHCLMDKKSCHRQSKCPVHRAFERARGVFLNELEKNTLAALLKEEEKIAEERKN